MRITQKARKYADSQALVPEILTQESGIQPENATSNILVGDAETAGPRTVLHGTLTALDHMTFY